MTVSYSVPALVRAKVARKGGAVQFVTKADPKVALEAVRAAAVRATAPFLGADMDEEAAVSVSGCAAAPDGPIVVFGVCDGAELLEAWLASAATDLEQAGLSGRFQAAKSVETPQINAPMITLGIALEVDVDLVRSTHQTNLQSNSNDRPGMGWFVSEERTRRVLPGLIAWCLAGPGQVHLLAGAGMDISPDDVEPILMASVGATTQILVQRVTPDRRHLRRLKLNIDGEIICTTYDAGLNWSDQLRNIQEPLRHVAPDAIYGYTRISPPTMGLVWSWKYPPPIPYVAAGGRTSMRLWPFNTLLDRYIPDAYPQQLLTSQHLDRVGVLPPDRWNVEPLGADRYLVSATDATPWLDVDPAPYADQNDTLYTRVWAPGPDVLEQARADLAPILMTTEIVAENRPQIALQ